METNENGGRNKKLFVAALIAMALINVVTLYFMFSEKKEKQEVIVQKTNVEQDYKTISDSLDAKKQEIGALLGKNATMDKEITEKQAMIDQEKATLADLYSKNQLNDAEINKARKLIAGYETTITDLKKQVADYAVKNQTLTAQTEQLSTDLNCETDAANQLSSQNETLTKKVDAGSVLQIAKVDVEAVKRKHNGDEVAVSKAKTAEGLKISFETGANKVIDPGTMVLYVRIINPRGETIAVKEQGSGVIPATADASKQVEYTKKADFYYNQNNKKVVVYWNRYVSDPGTYKVEVYQSGKVVGHGAVHLT